MRTQIKIDGKWFDVYEMGWKNIVIWIGAVVRNLTLISKKQVEGVRLA
jgi:hypothetical protein